MRALILNHSFLAVFLCFYDANWKRYLTGRTRECVGGAGGELSRCNLSVLGRWGGHLSSLSASKAPCSYTFQETQLICSALAGMTCKHPVDTLRNQTMKIINKLRVNRQLWPSTVTSYPPPHQRLLIFPRRPAGWFFGGGFFSPLFKQRSSAHFK